MRIVAVVPVKAAAAGKRRLSPSLDGPRRERLVRVMLQSVLAALRNSTTLTGLCVLTPEAALVPHDIEWIPDNGGGLNRELLRAAASVRSADAMLILPADLPWITARDIDSLLSKARPDQIVVVPDKAELGTNALLLCPPHKISPRFGEHSLELHMRSAQASASACRIHRCSNLARDIDAPADLVGLHAHPSDQFDFLWACSMAGA
jgi:2-phospho-L-lactate/phosphoenolpyruvate guanylyltransferase